jgi:hypothetical protein
MSNSDAGVLIFSCFCIVLAAVMICFYLLARLRETQEALQAERAQVNELMRQRKVQSDLYMMRWTARRPAPRIEGAWPAALHSNAARTIRHRRSA